MENETILLKNGTLIDGTGSAPIHNVVIEVVNGRFGTIAQYDEDNRTLNGNVKEIDLEGLVILPGLIHAHAHTSFKYLQNEPLHGYHTEYLAACLKEGITTVRDEGMTTNAAIDDVIAHTNGLDSLMYPRIITSGKVFTAPGG
jgi:predicted amidohydrolase